MSMQILYFASLREAIGTGAERIELPAGVRTAGELQAALARRSERHEALLSTKNLRVALNQTMCGMDAPVADGDEVAFFPPVTGG